MVQGKDTAPCTFCGVFRKNALNKMAKRLGACKVATGHNLDDEAQSVMMNYLKGDIQRLMRLRPRREQPGLVPRIKPLRDIPEKEIALYCMVNGVFADARECPYAKLSLRADVRDMMNSLENLFPGTKQSTMQGFEKLAEMARDEDPSRPGSMPQMRRALRRGSLQSLPTARKAERMTEQNRTCACP